MSHTPALVYNKTFYVSTETGSDSYTGLTLQDPFATLSAAITAANAASPAFGSPVLIKIIDTGSYNPGAGSVTLSGFVNIVAPGAVLTGNATPSVLSGSFNYMQFAAINGTDLEIRQTSGTGFGGFTIDGSAIYNVDGLFTMLTADGASGDTLNIHSQTISGTGNLVNIDTGEVFITTSYIGINPNSASDVAAISISGAGTTSFIVCNDIDGTNSGAGDVIGIQVAAGAKSHSYVGCNTLDVAYDADGANSEIFVFGEIALTSTVTETNSGVVYRNSMSEGVYIPNLTTQSTVDTTNDFVKFWDNSDGGHRKINVSDFINSVTLNLSELGDVTITTLAEGHTLYYDATTSMWKNNDSVYYDDVNKRLGINTSSPDEELHVGGSIKMVDGTQGAGKVMVSDANGVASWGTAGVTFANQVVSKIATYTAVNGDLILCDASGGIFTIDLPAAVDGNKIIVKKTDSSSNAITIDGNASETIDGATTITLNTQYENVMLVGEASTGWHIVG